ncbi:MAG: Arc family DNA-binding protein [Solirubrobacterales bacterium]|nr:Arc family DNA-binding protein [Solirubrobacterales bacterium]
MATLYVRNVPTELHDQLRGKAESAGRSINAEAIEVLKRGLANGSGTTLDDVIRKSDEIRSRHTLPAGSPTAAELVREDRDR